MNNDTRGLDSLEMNEQCRVVSLENRGAFRRRLRDMGVIEGTKIECCLVSAFSDPKAYKVRGTVIALRNADAHAIKVSMIRP